MTAPRIIEYRGRWFRELGIVRKPLFGEWVLFDGLPVLNHTDRDKEPMPIAREITCRCGRGADDDGDGNCAVCKGD